MWTRWTWWSGKPYPERSAFAGRAFRGDAGARFYSDNRRRDGRPAQLRRSLGVVRGPYFVDERLDRADSRSDLPTGDGY